MFSKAGEYLILSLAGAVTVKAPPAKHCLTNKDVGGKDRAGSLNDDKNPPSSLS